MRGKLLNFSIIALFLFLSAIMVFSAAVATVRNPASHGSYRSDLLFNVVVADNAPGNHTLNVTAYGINITGGILFLGANTTSPNQTNYNFTVTTSSFADGVYNITVNATHENGSQYVVQNTSVFNVTFDNTAPTVLILTPTDHENSTSTDLNITYNVTDNTDVNGINCTLYLNSVFNSSALVVSGAPTKSFNVTSIVEANYLINVSCVDAAGNIGEDTANATRDRTAPSSVNVTFSPANPVYGDTVTITCNASDNINLSLTKNISISEPGQSAYNVRLETGDTKEFTQTQTIGTYRAECNVTDAAGNLNSTNATFNVGRKELNERFSGIGADTTVGKKIITSGSYSDVGELGSEGASFLMAKTASLNFMLNGEEHSLYVKELAEDSVTFTLSSDPIDISMVPGETGNYDLDGDSANDVAITLHGISRGRADVTVALLSATAPVPTDGSEPTETSDGAPTSPSESGKKSSMLIWILIAVIVLIIIFLILRRRGSGKLRFSKKDLGGGSAGGIPPYQGGYVQPRQPVNQQQMQPANQQNQQFRYQ